MQKLLYSCNYLFLKVGIYMLLLLSNGLFAQDMHFSQFSQTASLVNPALIGISHTVKASVIYKDQWRGVTVPYKTFGASFEMKFKANNWEKADQHKSKAYKKSTSRLAGGLSFYRDQAGDGKMGTSLVSFSLATFVPIRQKSLLSAGIQTGLVQRTIDFSKLVFPDQYNGVAYDPTMFSGENGYAQNYSYVDVASGMSWSYGYNEKSIGANNTLRANAGVAVYHINRPKQHFLTAPNDELNRKLVLHGEATIGVPGTTMAFIPSFLFQFQGNSKDLLLGLMTKYYFKEDSKYTGFNKRSAFGIGAALRTGDALIISSQVEIGQYAFGFSYDINVSGLTKASIGRGGPEIFIRFVSPTPFLNQMSGSKSRYNLN